MPEESPDPAVKSCLILHGLGGGPYEVAPLTEALRDAGLQVSAPIMPGHDGPGPIMPGSRWEDWASAVEAAFDAMEAPTAVLGFSTGGTLALWLAKRRPVARMVLLAPFLAIRYSRWIPIRPARYLRQIARVVPDLPRRPPAARDPRVRREIAAQWQFRTFSIAASLSALELIDLVKPTIPSIDIPTLIIQGKHDSVVEPREASWIYDHLGSAQKRFLLMNQSDHLVALDHDRERVKAEVLAFITGSGKTA